MHQAFAAHSVSTPIQDFCSEFGFGRGRGRSSSRSRGRGGKGRGFGGRVQQPQINSSNHNTCISATGQPPLGNGGTYPVSYNSYFVGTNAPSRGVLGSHPSTIIFQICGSLGHTALQCTNMFNNAFALNSITDHNHV